MSEKAPGLEEYTPTRLDWLEIKLNSLLGGRSLKRDGIDLFFLVAEDGKSIELTVRHYADMDEDGITDIINTVENFVLQIAKDYKWDSWIELKKEIVKVDRRKKE